MSSFLNINKYLCTVKGFSNEFQANGNFGRDGGSGKNIHL